MNWIVVLLTFTSLIFAQESIIGIDIGTEWLRIGIFNSKAKYPLEIVINEQSNRKTPALIGFTNSGERVFGNEAEGIVLRNPNKAFSFELKRILGQKFNSEAVHQFKADFPFYKLAEDGETHSVRFEDSQLQLSLSVEEIFAMIFSSAKQMASQFSEIDIKECVVTVPSWFSKDQRILLEQSAQLANLKVKHIINDITAVAVDYASINLGTNDETRKVIFYSVGHRGASASLIEFKIKDKAIGIQVLDTQYEQYVGGFQFDKEFVNFLADEFDKKLTSGETIRNSRKSMTKLIREAKSTKEDCLSSSSLCDIVLDELYQGVDFHYQISKETYDKITEKLYDPMTKVLDKLLEKVEKKSEISAIELFGGAIRYPKVGNVLQKYQIPVGRHINSDESSVLGATYYGAVLLGANVPSIRKVQIVKEVESPEVAGEVKPLTSEQLERSRKILVELDNKEKARKESIQAKNKLESFIVDSRDKIESSSFSQSLKDQVTEVLNNYSSWLEDQSGFIEADVYLSKLKELSSEIKKLTGKDEL